MAGAAAAGAHSASSVAAGCGVAALVGALIAPRYTYIEPNGVFSPELSFIVVIMALLGGTGRLWGPIVGVIPFALLQEFINAVREAYERHAMMGEMPVLLTSPQIRPYVRSIIERFRPSTMVMSQNEVHPKAKIKTLGQI